MFFSEHYLSYHDIGEAAHDRTAVKSVCVASMTRKSVIKVFSMISSLHTTSEESHEWTDQRGKKCKATRVQSCLIYSIPSENANREIVFFFDINLVYFLTLKGLVDV